MKHLNILSIICLILSIQVAVAQPDWQFANAFGQSEDPSMSSTYVRNLATDSNGNYYVVGMFDGTITGSGFFFYDEDGNEQLTGFIIKFNSAGEYLWHRQVYTPDGTPYTEASINGVATDNNGDVYISGFFAGTADLGGGISITSTATGTYSMFIAKLTGSDGVTLWANESAGDNSSYGKDLVINNNSELFVTGYFSGTANFNGTDITSSGGSDAFIAGYLSDGSFQWVNKIGDTDTDISYSITTDNANLYIIGKYNGTPTIGSTTLPSGTSDMFIAKCSNAGVWQNASSFSCTNDYGFGYMHDIDCDNDGNVFVVGGFNTDIDFGNGMQTFSNYPGYLAKYNNTLVYQWDNIMNSSDADPDNGTFSVKTDADNNVLAIGSFNNSLDFGSGIVITDGQQHQAPYIAKFNNGGDIQYAEAFQNQTGGFGSFGLAIDVVGNSVYVAGELKNPINIGNFTVASPDDAYYVWVASDFALPSSENDILSFALAEQAGNAIIDNVNHTVDVEVVYGTNVAALTPTITVSENASINPESGTEQDFTAPFEYTVTAENEDEQIWMVTVEVQQSNENNILTFILVEQTGDAVIDNENHTVYIEVVAGTNVTNLTPTIEISESASIDPASGVSQDFTNPVDYTVTAQNGDEQIWVVTVDIATSVNNVSVNDFKLYPNPSTGIINLTGFKNLIGLNITDITGKTIYTRGHVPLATPSQIDLSGFDKGFYFIRVNTSEKSYIEKLIIQ